MEQETTQVNMAVEKPKINLPPEPPTWESSIKKTMEDILEKEKPIKSSPPDPLTIVQTHLNKITISLKENTVALVEMGIIIRRLENTLEQLIKERAHG